MSFKLAVYLYLLLIRVTGAEPNPTSGWQGRLDRSTAGHTRRHTPALTHTHFDKDNKYHVAQNGNKINMRFFFFPKPIMK